MCLSPLSQSNAASSKLVRPVGPSRGHMRASLSGRMPGPLSSSSHSLGVQLGPGPCMVLCGSQASHIVSGPGPGRSTARRAPCALRSNVARGREAAGRGKQQAKGTCGSFHLPANRSVVRGGSSFPATRTPGGSLEDKSGPTHQRVFGACIRSLPQPVPHPQAPGPSAPNMAASTCRARLGPSCLLLLLSLTLLAGSAQEGTKVKVAAKAGKAGIAARPDSSPPPPTAVKKPKAGAKALASSPPLAPPPKAKLAKSPPL